PVPPSQTSPLRHSGLYRERASLIAASGRCRLLLHRRRHTAGKVPSGRDHLKNFLPTCVTSSNERSGNRLPSSASESLRHHLLTPLSRCLLASRRLSVPPRSVPEHDFRGLTRDSHSNDQY